MRSCEQLAKAAAGVVARATHPWQRARARELLTWQCQSHRAPRRVLSARCTGVQRSAAGLRERSQLLKRARGDERRVRELLVQTVKPG